MLLRSCKLNKSIDLIRSVCANGTGSMNHECKNAMIRTSERFTFVYKYLDEIHFGIQICPTKAKEIVVLTSTVILNLLIRRLS